jgi:hypothetical protein
VLPSAGASRTPRLADGVVRVPAGPCRHGTLGAMFGAVTVEKV